jgi:DNA-binding SARP family transcriptional activator
MAPTGELSLEFRVLGTFEVAASGRVIEIGSPKQRALLALLVVHLNRPVASEVLVDELWRGNPPVSVQATVQSLVYRLRRTLSDAGAEAAGVALRGRGAAYLLEADRLQVDLHRFEGLVSRGRELLAAGAADQAAGRLTDALALWRGPAFADIGDVEFARMEAVRLEELRHSVLEALAAAELVRDRPESAVALLESHIARHPLRENAWGQLMTALYRLGRQADALRAYHQLRSVLREELGLEPNPALQHLEQLILRQSPELGGDQVGWLTVPAPSTVPPRSGRGDAARSLTACAVTDVEASKAFRTRAFGDEVSSERLPFVGRDRERAELRRLLDQAVRGSGSLVMVGGEPGVGKTRLAEELMAEATARDVQVFAGHSYEMEGAAPFIAVVEIFETALAQASGPAAFRSFLGEEAAEVVRLLPKLRQLCPDIPPPLELPPEQERRLLFNSVREVIARTARRRPMLLIFDDLHWADDPTLLLVEHLAAGVAELPVLMVATYRDTEVDVGRPLAKTFEDLRRRHLCRWITLPRLAEEEVGLVLRGLSGQEVPSRLVRAIYGDTEGNPFFLGEVYRHLAEEGRLFDAQGRFRNDLTFGELDVPTSVRLVVERRLQRLDARTMPVLAAAAVAGRAFSVELLEAIEDLDPDSVLNAVEEAERARLLAPAPNASGEDRFIFAHELIRQTLLADLSLTRRRRIHARLADACEHHYANRLDHQAATIAHHLLEAGSSTDPERAFPYLIRAGRFAMASAAFEEALRHYRRAQAVEGTRQPAARAELLFELGTAAFSAGQLEEAVDAWRLSVEAYEKLGDADAVGRVCLPACYSLMFLGDWEEALAFGERALGGLGQQPTVTRGRLLGMTAVPLAYTGRYRAANDRIEEELDLAARLDDEALLAEGLWAKAMVRMAHMKQREVLEAAARAADLFHASGDVWNRLNASGYMAYALTCLGRFDELRALTAELLPKAERLGNVTAALHLRRMRSLVDFVSSGDIDVLETLAKGDLEQLEITKMPWASGWAWAGLVLFLRGDWDGALPLFEEAARREPAGAMRGWNATLLFECLAYRGEKQEALALLDARQLPTLDEESWTWGAASLLFTAVDGLTVLGEWDRAAALYPIVVDVFERTGVVTPAYEDGRLYERAAGIAASAARRWDAAEQHFRRAIQQAAKLPHRLEEAHSRRFYAAMLLRRDSPGDPEHARQLLAQAVADYRRMGMPRHITLAEAMIG